MNLTEKCIKIAKENGANLVGIASVENYKFDPSSEKHPRFYMKNAQAVIVMGLKLVDALWDNLRGKQDVHSMNLYNYLIHYNYDLLDYIAIQTARFLEEEGYDAYPVQAIAEKRNGLLYGYFSFKGAAMAAGLGSQGKHSLVVTPQYGPRVRWVAVITDAPLICNEPNTDPPGTVCKGCTKCLESCPVGALSFDEETKTPVIDKVKCQWWMDRCQCAYCQGVCTMGHIAANNRRKAKRRETGDF